MKSKIINALIMIACITLVIFSFFTVSKLKLFQDTLEQLQEIEEIKLVSTDSQTKVFINNPTPQTYDTSAQDYECNYNYKYIYMLDDTAFVSNSDNWDNAKLAELSAELMRNKHGEELSYLSMVIMDDSDNCIAAGYQESVDKSYTIPLSTYNILPPNMSTDISVRLSQITILGADTYTTVEEIAPVLSHEYGHHFTEYHFGLTYTEDDIASDYYQLRGDDERIRFDMTGSYNDYLNNHMWYLFEIGAEDYVYLMGSETSRQIVQFYDSYDKLSAYADSECAYQSINYNYTPSLNGTPHENTVLPLPSEVSGLAEYFYSFIDEDPPQYTDIEQVGNLSLQADKLDNKQYQITWDKPYTDDDVLYSLLVFDRNDRLLFIEKSIWGNENAIANFGAFQIEKNSDTHTFYTGIPRGTELHFKVTITFTDGTVVISDPLEMIF